MTVEVRAYIQSQLDGLRNLRTSLQGELQNLNRQETMLLGLLEQVPAPVPPVHTPLPFGERLVQSAQEAVDIVRNGHEVLPPGTVWNEEGQYYELPDGTRRAQAGWR